jgi:5'-3' exoribonuclease 2
MGIPLYFRKIIQDYPDILCKVEELKNSNKNNIFFDFNCLIHHACAEARHKFPQHHNNIVKLESCMLDEIKIYIESILNRIQNINIIYIGIDGVAPVAKMVQQRERRYRGVKYKKKINSIKNKFKLSIDTWDSNTITPGTKFMNKLANYLKDWKDSSIYKETIILSDASEPMEGEHKICNYIRTNVNLFKDENIMIYGLDADLIMLAMYLPCDQVYLLRESVHFNKIDSTKLLLLYIDDLRKHVISEVLPETMICSNDVQNDVIQDYIFIHFLMGNDFIPCIPSLSIKNDGNITLLKAYRDVISIRNETLIYGKQLINIKLFMECLRNILEIEQELYESLNISINKNRFYTKPYKHISEKLIQQQDCLPSFDKVKNEIEYGKEGWKDRYYKYYFDIDTDNRLEIEGICHEYCIGLMWNLYYYNDKQIDRQWYYPYPVAPLLEDLYNYILENGYVMMNIVFEDKPFIHAHEQLLSVLPPQSHYLLPKKYHNLMTSKESPIYDMFPSDFKLDMFGKRYYHECLPIIPNLDIDRVQHSVTQIS